MRGSDVDWPATAAAPRQAATAGRTGGSRMLLDELLARRNQPPPPLPDDDEPALTIEPVAVPPAGETGRRAARQRLAELEDAARRNLRSAEEARRLLLEEHARLRQESSARALFEEEAGALRRELERLRDHEEKRAAQEKNLAARAARAEIAEEIKRFHEEHDRVVHELDHARGTLTDHDGLVQEYAERLREEQRARAALQIELERAETAQRLAERSIERATETVRTRAEDELIRLATAESELADARSDRERLAAQVADLTAGDGVMARLSAEAEARDAELAQLTERAELAEQARDDAIAATEAEIVRARAEGDRLRAHAATLGDELAAVRATVVELQAAAPAPPPPVEVPTSGDAEPDRPPLARRRPGEARKRVSALPIRRAAASHAPEPMPMPGGHVPGPDPGAVVAPAAAVGPVAEPAESAAPPNGNRRTAMAALNAIASSSDDDFSFSSSVRGRNR